MGGISQRGVGGLWVEGKGPQPKVLYLDEPAAHGSRCEEGHKESAFTLFTYWIGCKRVRPCDASQQP